MRSSSPSRHFSNEGKYTESDIGAIATQLSEAKRYGQAPSTAWASSKSWRLFCFEVAIICLGKRAELLVVAKRDQAKIHPKQGSQWVTSLAIKTH
jgi:hypothetical protein